MSSENQTIQFLLSQGLKSSFKVESFPNPPVISGSAGMPTASSKDFSKPVLIQEIEVRSAPVSSHNRNNHFFHGLESGACLTKKSVFAETVDDILSSESFCFSDHLYLQFIVSIVERELPRSQKTKRIRTRDTEIKILYAIYQFNKNLKNRGWDCVYPCKRKIAKSAKVSIKAVTKFINDPDFQFFCKKEYRFDEDGYQTSNVYFLHPWLIEFFELFEKKGMMKYFTSDFKLWKKNFLERAEAISKVLESKEISLRELLMNKLSTKNKLKGATQDTLKGASSIKPSGNKAFQGYKSNIELPVLNDAVEIAGKLVERLSLKEGDVNRFMSFNTLSHLKRAIRRNEEWITNGMEIHYPERAFQKCLNLTKKQVSSYPR